MEIPIEAPAGGVVRRLVATEGAQLMAGDVILLLEERA